MSATIDRTLRGRDFRLLWTGQSISKAGSAVTTFALPLVVVQTLNATIWLPWLLIGLQAGAWADRRSRRPLMIGCQLASAVLIVSIPICAGWHVLTIEYVIAVAFVAGCSNVVFTAAYNAYVPFLVGKPSMLGANSRLTGSEQVANIAGPGIGGLLAQFASTVLGLVVDSASFLVSAVCLWAIRAIEPDRNPADTPRTSIRADVRTAIDFVVRDPYLRVMTANAATANLFLSGLQALLVVFLLRTAELGPWAVGAVTVAISVGGFLGAFIAPRMSKRLGSARAMLVSTPITGFFGLLFPLAGHGWLLAVCLLGVLAWSMGVVMKNVITGSFRQTYCPPGMRGRVAMSMRFVTFGVMPIGSLVGGGLGALFGVQAAVWVLATANVFSSAMLFTGPIRLSRELPTEQVPVAGEPN
jgi:MFS family permease